MARQRFLIGCSLKYEDGKNYWENSDNWDNPDGLIDKIMELSTQNRIIESEYREIARTDPWTRTWSTCKNPKDIFGVNIIDLNDEQKTLLAWSILYDNVMEHPERPSEDVIEDDDAFDGWLIDKDKERKKRVTEKRVEDMIPENMKNATEIFIPVNTAEDARKIEDLNDENAKSIKRRREKAIASKGEVHEANLPDVNSDLRMEIVKKAHSAIKNRSK
jgi:hypothetical protein